MAWLARHLGDRDTVVDLDSFATLAAIVFLGTLGPAMFIVQPGYIEGLVRYAAMSEEGAGWVVAAEMFGIAISAVLVNLTIRRFNWRVLALAAVLLSLLGNALSLGQQDLDWLRLARFVTGLGSGALISLSFLMMGLTRRVDRNMGLIVVSVLVYGALGLFALPTVFAAWGLDALMWFLAAFSLAGLGCIGRIPRFPQTHPVHAETKSQASPLSRWTLLAGVLAYNLAIGLVWVYMFLVGIEAGIAEQSVANVLGISQFFGVGGALLVVMLETRINRLVPLIISILAAAAGIALLLGEPVFALYALGVCLFNTAWNVTQPYLVALLAAFDWDGHLVSLGITMQLVGYALGPTAAAALLGPAGYDGINIIAVALFVCSVGLVCLGLRVNRGQRQRQQLPR